MKKIVPVTYMLVRDEDVEFNTTNCFSFGATNGVPLYDEDALQAVAEAVREAVIAEIFSGDVVVLTRAVERFFSAGAVRKRVKQVDIASLINQLKGQ